MPGELEFNPLAGELKLGLSPVASVWPRAVFPVPGQRRELMGAVRNSSNPWIPTQLWVLPSTGSALGFPLEAVPNAILSPTETKPRLLEQM